MRRLPPVFILLALVLWVGAAPALATHKPGHHEPPACDPPPQSNSKAPEKNKHCYPPPAPVGATQGKKASFSTEAPEPPRVTVGMAALAVLAVGTVLYFRRRWTFTPAER
jgi:hypothetical protein